MDYRFFPYGPDPGSKISSGSGSASSADNIGQTDGSKVPVPQAQHVKQFINSHGRRLKNPQIPSEMKKA